MNLREYCKTKGTNIKQLAEKLGIAPSTLYSISNGETSPDNVGISLFMSIASALDCTTEELHHVLTTDEVHYAFVELPDDEMSIDERELLTLYRNMDEKHQSLLLENARAFSALSEKDTCGAGADVERAGIAVM